MEMVIAIFTSLGIVMYIRRREEKVEERRRIELRLGRVLNMETKKQNEQIWREAE